MKTDEAITVLKNRQAELQQGVDDIVKVIELIEANENSNLPACIACGHNEENHTQCWGCGCKEFISRS